MDPLQIIIVKAAAALLGLATVLGSLSWLLFKGIDLAVEWARARRAAGRSRREAKHSAQARWAAGFAEQPAVLARYEQEMQPLSDFYIFDEPTAEFPTDRTYRSHR